MYMYHHVFDIVIFVNKRTFSCEPLRNLTPLIPKISTSTLKFWETWCRRSLTCRTLTGIHIWTDRRIFCFRWLAWRECFHHKTLYWFISVLELLWNSDQALHPFNKRTLLHLRYLNKCTHAWILRLLVISVQCTSPHVIAHCIASSKNKVCIPLHFDIELESGTSQVCGALATACVPSCASGEPNQDCYM